MRKILIRSVAALAALAMVTACGSNSSTDKQDQSGLSPDSILPSSIQDSGVIRVGSQINLPPFEYYKEGTKEITGVDWDLAQAIGRQLGVRVEFVNGSFATLIAGLSAGRWDMTMSTMYDTVERQKSADFVDYINSGGSLLVKKGNPENLHTLEDLCGKQVGVQQGSVLQKQLEDQADKCQQSGAGKLDLATYTSAVDGKQQVILGRSVAYTTDLPISIYVANTEGAGKIFDVVEAPFTKFYYGIGIKKTNTKLTSAVKGALQKLIDDGTYAKVLDKYGLKAAAIDSAQVNAAKE